MMVPVGRLIVLRTAAERRLIRAIAVLTWPGLTAPLIGPAAGRFLSVVSHGGGIFLVNVPLGSRRLARAGPGARSGRGERKPFDRSVSCSAVGRVEGRPDRARPIAPAGTGGRSADAGGPPFCFRLVRRTSPPPPADRPQRPPVCPRLRADPVGTAAMLAGSLIATMPFLLPLLFQIGFGMDAFHAGLLVIALFAGNIGIKPLTTLIIRRWGSGRSSSSTACCRP